jgi:uncharacterized protein YbaA (DUF1428 family)
MWGVANKDTPGPTADFTAPCRVLNIARARLASARRAHEREAIRSPPDARAPPPPDCHRQENPMTYVDGFVMAVPTANREKFLAHAREFDPLFLEFGATRVLECWGDDVPLGKLTDFHRAVQATDDETVVFSWVEWPDKATRDAGVKKMMDDPRMDPEASPMPFDGKRMIFGGFSPALDLRH